MTCTAAGRRAARGAAGRHWEPTAAGNGPAGGGLPRAGEDGGPLGSLPRSLCCIWRASTPERASQQQRERLAAAGRGWGDSGGQDPAGVAHDDQEELADGEGWGQDLLCAGTHRGWMGTEPRGGCGRLERCRRQRVAHWLSLSQTRNSAAPSGGDRGRARERPRRGDGRPRSRARDVSRHTDEGRCDARTPRAPWGWGGVGPLGRGGVGGRPAGPTDTRTHLAGAQLGRRAVLGAVGLGGLVVDHGAGRPAGRPSFLLDQRTACLNWASGAVVWRPFPVRLRHTIDWRERETGVERLHTDAREQQSRTAHTDTHRQKASRGWTGNPPQQQGTGGGGQPTCRPPHTEGGSATDTLPSDRAQDFADRGRLMRSIEFGRARGAPPREACEGPALAARGALPAWPDERWDRTARRVGHSEASAAGAGPGGLSVHGPAGPQASRGWAESSRAHGGSTRASWPVVAARGGPGGRRQGLAGRGRQSWRGHVQVPVQGAGPCPVPVRVPPIPIPSPVLVGPQCPRQVSAALFGVSTCCPILDLGAKHPACRRLPADPRTPKGGGTPHRVGGAGATRWPRLLQRSKHTRPRSSPSPPCVEGRTRGCSTGGARRLHDTHAISPGQQEGRLPAGGLSACRPRTGHRRGRWPAPHRPASPR